VLQLDEVVAATQTAELLLAAPALRVLGDVPAVVDGNAVAFGRSPRCAEGGGASAHHLFEALARDALALAPRAEAHPRHDLA
jgi:hypothetical protein